MSRLVGGTALLLLQIAGLAMAQKSMDTAAIDKTAEPCTDFYQYACGNWTKANPIPGDQSRWSRFNELSERSLRTLKDILETSSQKTTRSAIDRQIGDYYIACMDEKGIEAKGIAPLRPTLSRIAALKDKSELAAELGKMHLTGIPALFAFSVGQDYKNSTTVIAQAGEGGLSLPDRDYYLKTDPKSAQLREQFVGHVARILELAGDSKEDAAAQAKVVLELETALAEVTMDRVARRNPLNRYHPMTAAEFVALVPSFNFQQYWKSTEAPTFDRMNVIHVDFYKGLEQLLTRTPLENMKVYLKWKALNDSAPRLTNAFVEENFNFYGRTLTGSKELRPRWKRCVAEVDANLGEALGQKYVEMTFGTDAKKRMDELIGNLEKALEKDIETLDWMSDATKKRAVEKLHSMQDKVGHPAKWRDYSAVEVKKDDAIGNAQRASAFERRRLLGKINKPVDTTEWSMTPPTVNAYYVPAQNNINFPAGILQPPFFDAKIDDPVNYGGIGAVIGHEITHGFDDQGRRFDAKGNMQDWWTAADAKNFVDRASCIDQQYAEYVAIDDLKVNGKLTLGENVADNGGLRIAYLALQEALQGKERKSVDGYTPEQRFFLGWGQIWCTNMTDEAARLRVQTDPHSPGKYRTNGTLSNMPEFWKAWGCKEGQPMVRGDKACRVW